MFIVYYNKIIQMKISKGKRHMAGKGVWRESEEEESSHTLPEVV